MDTWTQSSLYKRLQCRSKVWLHASSLPLSQLAFVIIHWMQRPAVIMCPQDLQEILERLTQDDPTFAELKLPGNGSSWMVEGALRENPRLQKLELGLGGPRSPGELPREPCKPSNFVHIRQRVGRTFKKLCTPPSWPRSWISVTTEVYIVF